MKIELVDWWLTIRIDYVCWADFHIVSLFFIALAVFLVRKAINWWRWRHADKAEYFLTEEGWDKL